MQRRHLLQAATAATSLSLVSSRLCAPGAGLSPEMKTLSEYMAAAAARALPAEAADAAVEAPVTALPNWSCIHAALEETLKTGSRSRSRAGFRCLRGRPIRS